ncbi:hypothetical protein [Dyella sp. C9]|uniref:hypothetical protein n=1 Tax=Dyella sp. C9 TaxID=2202154 RepID=UPI000DEFE457|nr:hypothetical protein [Dyella sp. C9]
MTEEPQSGLLRAFDELLDLYRLLEQENELLRGQLRRHAAGEMQIREAERRMMEMRGISPSIMRERFHALLAARHP